MGDPFTDVSVSNYNVNAPADDGSETSSNRVSWAPIKSKIGDPLKTAIESMTTNVGAAVDKLVGGAGIVSTSVDYTVLSSDQSKLIKVTAADKTVTTPAAATVGSPFIFGVLNDSSGDLTLDGNSSETIDGSDTITIPAGNGVTVQTDGTNWFTWGQNFTRSFPPPSAFKNLSIKVATNTTVTVAADFVVVTDGTKFQTLAFSSTIDMGTTGADALDTGTIAIDTWYAIWAIAKADGTAKCLASTSGTSPTMPSGYTYKARIGWVRTIHASATLYGTWQLGRRAQYVVGLAQTSASRNIAGSTSGSISTPTWTACDVSGFVPTTASVIRLYLCGTAASGSPSGAIAAPNNSYGAYNSTSAPPPMNTVVSLSSASANITVMGEFILESSNVYYASNDSSAGLNCLGWEDNI